MVGAVHPSRAGETEVFEGETDHSGVPGRDDRYRVEVPIFRSVAEAVAATGATASVVYVPPPFAADAIMEAADAGLDLVICITEGIPVADMVRAKRFLEDKGTPTRRSQLSRRDHARLSARSASCRATSTLRGASVS